MPPVEIYTTPFCPYCHDAKALLKKKNVSFTEIDVSGYRPTLELLERLTPERRQIVWPHAPFQRTPNKKPGFTEIDVSRDRELRSKMTSRAGGRTTVPQIFIGSTHVGGCDDLYALDGSGGLDPLLNGKTAS